jgi:hypothetical protein
MNGPPTCPICAGVCLECDGTGECLECDGLGCASCDHDGTCPCCEGLVADPEDLQP